MNVQIEYAAVLDLVTPRNGERIELPEKTAVAGLLNQLNIDVAHQKFIVPFVNGRKVKPSAVLQDGDKVFLSLPIGGG